MKQYVRGPSIKSLRKYLDPNYRYHHYQGNSLSLVHRPEYTVFDPLTLKVVISGHSFPVSSLKLEIPEHLDQLFRTLGNFVYSTRRLLP